MVWHFRRSSDYQIIQWESRACPSGYAKVQHRFSKHLELLLELHHLRGEMDPPPHVHKADWGIRGVLGWQQLYLSVQHKIVTYMGIFLESAPLWRTSAFATHMFSTPHVAAPCGSISLLSNGPQNGQANVSPPTTTAPREQQFHMCLFKIPSWLCRCTTALLWPADRLDRDQRKLWYIDTSTKAQTSGSLTGLDFAFAEVLE